MNGYHQSVKTEVGKAVVDIIKVVYKELTGIAIETGKMSTDTISQTISASTA